MCFREIWYMNISWTSVEKIQVSLKFYETYVQLENVSDQICRENKNIFYVWFFFPLKNHAIYEIMWKYGRTRQATCDSIMNMQFACQKTKTIIQTHTHDI
jgi:hypothetical protein